MICKFFHSESIQESRYKINPGRAEKTSGSAPTYVWGMVYFNFWNRSRIYFEKSLLFDNYTISNL